MIAVTEQRPAPGVLQPKGGNGPVPEQSMEMDMTKLNDEMCELTNNDLDKVSGGSWFAQLLSIASFDTQGQIIDALVDASHRAGPSAPGK